MGFVYVEALTGVVSERKLPVVAYQARGYTALWEVLCEISQ